MSSSIREKLLWRILFDHHCSTQTDRKDDQRLQLGRILFLKISAEDILRNFSHLCLRWFLLLPFLSYGLELFPSFSYVYALYFLWIILLEYLGAAFIQDKAVCELRKEPDAFLCFLVCRVGFVVVHGIFSLV